MTATILHVPVSWFDRRVLIQFEPGVELYGSGTIVVRRSILRRLRG